MVTTVFRQQLNLDSVMQPGAVQQAFMNFTHKSMYENSPNKGEQEMDIFMQN